jgi:hypothetical protein
MFAFSVRVMSVVMFLVLWNWIVANTNLLSFTTLISGRETLATLYNMAPSTVFINCRLLEHEVAMK